MPIYEYRCENGHLVEVMQKIADPPVTACEACEAPVQRVFHPVAVHFKGSGFYNTDYGKGKAGAATATEGKSDSGTDSKDSAKPSSSESPSSGSSN